MAWARPASEVPATTGNDNARPPAQPRRKSQGRNRMNPTTHRGRWAIPMTLVGAVLAVIVYTVAVAADVVWTIIPLPLTVAAVRRILRRDASKP